MAGPQAVAKGKCPAGTIEISAGPVGNGPFKGRQVAAVCLDQGHMTNKAGGLLITPTSQAGRYEVIQFDAQGAPTVLSADATEAQANTLYEQWKAKYDIKAGGGFLNKLLAPAGVSMPHSPPRFAGDNQPLVNVPGKQVELDDGKTVLGAKEICERRGPGWRVPTPWELARAAGGPNQVLHSSNDGTLKQSAIHYCKDYRSKDPEVCPTATRNVGAGKGKGVYVSWLQSDGKTAEYFDGNGNAYTWAFNPENGASYLCGGSWFGVSPGNLEAGGCFGNDPEGFGSGTGVRCAVSPQ